MNYGAMLGLVLVVISLLIYILELYENQWISIISTIALIAGIVMGIKKFRDQENGGFISYGSALGYGTLICSDSWSNFCRSKLCLLGLCG